ncbi:MAG: ComEC/Rec2 family competence protein, partial [Planctomycetes bacterium]|nr:ComEC/Rec2 family competence protein [Planctomycetota bacterium]
MSSSGRPVVRFGQGAFFLAAASALGVLAAHTGGFEPGACGVALALAAAVTLACLVAGRTRCAGAALILSVAALGAYSASLEITPPPGSLRHILLAGDTPAEGKVLLFQGRVFERVPRGQAARNAACRYLVEITGLQAGTHLGRATGSIYLDTPAVIPWGSLIEGKAYFRIPAAPANPGQFDYARFLELRGITCLARAPAEGLIRVVGRISPCRFRRALAVVRRSFSERLDRLGLTRLGIIPAVLLGERTGLDAALRQSFIRSGTMHLLAISGLHLGIVVGLVWWVLRSVGVSAKGASFVSIVAAVCYAFLAGARPPVVRAALMAIFFFLALMTSRRALVLSVVSTAALVMLLWKPLELFKPGFQMSFAAVLGLSYLGGPLAARLGGLVSRGRFPAAALVHKALRVAGYSTGAWLGVAPLSAYHFHSVAFISPLANIVL